MLASTRAAGSLLLGPTAQPRALLAAGVAVHAGLSLAWASLLSRALPDRHGPAWGAAAGAAIAALDLSLIGRRFPLVRELQAAPQWADHVAFGTLVGFCRGVPRPGSTT